MRACEVTGLHPPHAKKFEEVANIANCIVMFREPGKMAAGLIAENYAMKGFRVDTKSCNWGPMAGFVCADPRLTKDQKYAAAEKNPTWTHEALSGHVVEKYFGVIHDSEWVADVMPIVLSEARIAYLKQLGAISPQLSLRGAGARDFIGVSKPEGAKFELPWRLIDANNATNAWYRNSTDGGRYYVLCIDKGTSQSFQQIYPKEAGPILFRGYQTILGLTNPGTKSRGFKACVTADYDLLLIWEKPKEDAMAARHNMHAELLKKLNPTQPLAPIISGGPGLPGVARMKGIDDRLQSQKHKEHYKFGDVSARVLQIKTMLNSALIGSGAYTGGNAIHHNDELGNMALAKGSLEECLPAIGFVPRAGTVLIENRADFQELVRFGRNAGYAVKGKEDWMAGT